MQLIHRKRTPDLPLAKRVIARNPTIAVSRPRELSQTVGATNKMKMMTTQTTAMQVRSATPADAAAILRVHRASILSLGVETYSLAEVESWAAGLVAVRYVEAMNEGGETFIVAAVADGALAAFCSFKDDEVKGLYVAPEWARRGVGSALLRRAEATIAAAGHRRIRLGASLSGQGNRIWRRCWQA